ncbi:uncharacterized protein LOC143429641 [Xylocopa sonorina]|uniref:uncharacterized protein LOC143429641 n=1 Tax=Xylocopa sonorina TaxID=1818115 RepID=UPI00403B08DF
MERGLLFWSFFACIFHHYFADLACIYLTLNQNSVKLNLEYVRARDESNDSSACVLYLSLLFYCMHNVQFPYMDILSRSGIFKMLNITVSRRIK